MPTNKEKFYYARVNVRSQDNLEEFARFAKRLKHSGVDVGDWLMERARSYMKTDAEKFGEGFITAKAAILWAKKAFDFNLTRYDLKREREKKKLPKLREGFDYRIAGGGKEKNRYLYKRERIARLVQRLKRERGIEDAPVPVKRLNANRKVTLINSFIEE